MQPTPRSNSQSRLSRLVVTFAIAASIATINFFVWPLFDRRVVAPDHQGVVAGFSYNGAGRWQSPASGVRPAMSELEQDLALLAQHTRRIRTYSVADHPNLPVIAQKHGMQVMLGAWLDDRLDANQREVSAAIELARTHPNVHRVIVGNETQLKAKLPPNRLAAYLDQTRSALRATPVQVSTAEPWHVWLLQPQLAQHVDFIAIHVLPYWEKASIDLAVQTSIEQIERVQARFPNRKVVVAEIGWPSNGATLGDAEATAANQALFVRRFLQEAHRLQLDYYLIEAFDQPWKIANEGRAGAYWGMWDTLRNQKFELTGPVAQDPLNAQKAWASSGVGAMLMLAFLLALPNLRLVARVAFCVSAQAVASLGVVLLSIPLVHYLTFSDLVGLAFVLAALAFIGATLLSQSFEFCDRFWPSDAERMVEPKEITPTSFPFISIHVACANEPVDMVTQTVESLLAIDWPNFEVVVVDNNTSDAQARGRLAHWMAQRNDPRLRFAQWEKLSGYKAGALNQALAMTDPVTEWIAVVDADYLVDSQWFKAVQRHLSDSSVGVVQAPQAHRRWSSRWFDRMMNWETAGFFWIGMHHRHARNAIIQHGTMTMVRAADLKRLKWNEDCICEDTELGLRLLQSGYRAVYVDRVLGEGLLPNDFAAYARQRKRWAQGAMQIFKWHARSLLGHSRLTLAQRYHFLAGWLPWLGDALHLGFSLVMIVFSLGMVYFPSSVQPPLWLLVVPLIAFFTARLLVGPLLYTRCVPCDLRDRIGAAIAGMALSHRIACGVFQGLIQRSAVFEITQKSGENANATHSSNASPCDKRPQFVQGIGEEFALLVGLLFCVCLLAISGDISDVGRMGWMAILIIQSLPYWAAVTCRLIEIHGARLAPQSAAVDALSTN
jgi:exo-beta-1,3-glucanase (GH17 family)/cellulose synthase/poly-beta-1,6-N-acetylglucosamine synthase-like glycosyltransferase